MSTPFNPRKKDCKTVITQKEILTEMLTTSDRGHHPTKAAACAGPGCTAELAAGGRDEDVVDAEERVDGSYNRGSESNASTAPENGKESCDVQEDLFDQVIHPFIRGAGEN